MAVGTEGTRMPFVSDMPNCPNLAVPAEVMQHVVNVESSSNPYAIGVVGARLERQPQNLDEAVATVRMLESQGYNFSLGVAQVNRYNLAKYGLDSYDKAFDTCSNLVAGSRILAQCYAQSGGDWGKSFSCYYSGNFTKGYDDGYVQKIYDSINRSASSSALPAQPIPVQMVRTSKPVPMSAEQYRVSMRSQVLDAVGSALVTNIAQSFTPSQSAQPRVPTSMPSAPSITTQTFPATAALALAGNQSVAAQASNEVFVPQVRGPNDSISTAQQSTAAAPPPSDQADLRLQGRDDAFVF